VLSHESELPQPGRPKRELKTNKAFPLTGMGSATVKGENCTTRTTMTSTITTRCLRFLSGVTVLCWPTAIHAQIIPDATLGAEGSQVIFNAGGLPLELIQGGAIREQNLFHSFAEFNIDEGRAAYFIAPSDAIANIFSRVTGNNPSNILGILGTTSDTGGITDANLYFINPNGIVFGENAALDIGGSFFASTAEAIQFGDGIYSATVPASSSLLTVNPSVLFGNYLTTASGDITSQGQLEVGGSLTLVANRLDLAGSLSAQETLTLLANGDIAITDNIVVTFESGEQDTVEENILIQGENISVIDSFVIASSQVALTNGDENLSTAEVLPIGGNLEIQGDNILVINSILSTAGNRGQRGAIQLTAKESVDIFATVDQSFDLNSSIVENGIAGDIIIRAGSLNIVDANSETNFGDVSLSAAASGDGDGGNIILNVEGTTQLDGSFVGTIAEAGTAGSIHISTTDLILKNGAFLNSGTNTPAGEMNIGNAGDITIEADGSITMSSFGRRLLVSPFFDVLLSSISATTSGERGESGTIRVAADSLILDDLASISASSNSFDPAGEIQISVNELQLRNGGNIGSNGSGGGSAGNINIDVDGTATFIGVSANGQNPSGIFSRTFDDSDGGSINLTATQLNLLEGATVSTANFGSGNGGDITLNIAETALLEGIDPISQDSASSLDSSTYENATGDSGDIRIQADELILREGASVYSATLGQGNAGEQTFEVGSIQLLGGSQDFVTGFFSDVNEGASGNGGNVLIRADELILKDGSVISTDTFGSGNASQQIFEVGNIQITGGSPIFFTGFTSGVSEGASGSGGDQFIQTDSLAIQNGGFISAFTAGDGDAGNLFIESGNIYLSGANQTSGILTSVAEGANGNAGSLDIQASQLILENGAVINAGTLGNGDGGDLIVQASDIQLIGSSGDGTRSGLSAVAFTTAIGNGGDLQIDSDSLVIRDGAFLGATTDGLGNAGNIIVNSNRTFIDGVALEVGVASGIFARTRENAQGFGGDINLTTEELTVANGAVINAQTFNAFASGDITINANSAEFTNGGQVVTSTSSSGDAGSITLNILDAARFSGSDVTFDARLQQVLTTEDLSREDFSNESPTSGLFANTREESTGNGGRILVNAPNLILENRAQISSQSQGTGFAGPVIINAPEQLRLTDSDITTVASQSSGGDILVNLAEGSERGLVILIGDSDITTESFGDGGNITLGGAAVIAFDDSDIIARSQSGRGGNITLTNFFSETIPPDNQPPFDGDGRVDVNADGEIASGTISSLDTSFVENSLNELAGEIVDTAVLTAGSCIARSSDAAGSFVVTGRDGLPQQPGGDTISAYPTGTVQVLTETTALSAVQEPEGVYQLADGRLVLSHECR